MAIGLGAERVRANDPFAVEAIAPAYELLQVPSTDGAAVAPEPAPVVSQHTARSCPAPPLLPATGATGAFAAGTTLPVYAAPDGRVVHTLANPTREGQQIGRA